jgi:hydroxyacylglutathione hydrolase
MLMYTTFQVGPLGCNCTILGDGDTHDAIVIDPGDELPRIIQALQEHNWRVKSIVHTHAHIDHVGATAGLSQHTGAPTYLHDGDLELHGMLHIQAQLLGLPEPESGPIDHSLKDDMTLPFGAYELAVLHTPGHTPGSVCFWVANEDLCFSGDTLFAGGIGRTDLWGGDPHAITRSIQQRLYSLNGACQVVPGHGPVTTIDRERVSNPFVRAIG